HRARQPRHAQRADRDGSLEAVDEPARAEERPHPLRRGQPDASLRAAAPRRARSARARDPSGGLPVRRLASALAVLAAILLCVVTVALFVGSAHLSPRAVLAALTGRAGDDSIASVVTLGLRLPRILVAALAGG